MNAPMTDSAETTSLPPILALLRATPAGEVYYLGDKQDVVDGFLACSGTPVAAVSLGEGGESILVRYGNYSTVAFQRTGDRVTVTPGSICSRAMVVTVWAILKRIVSPESLVSVQFNQRHLAEVARMLDAPSDSLVIPSPGHPGRSRLRDILQSGNPHRPSPSSVINVVTGYRLMLEEKHDRLWGTITHRNEPVYSWMKAPVELQRFMLRHYYFEPTAEYFAGFSRISGNYPIVFRKRNGQELVLTYQDDDPRCARACLDLSGDTVTVSRVVEGGVLPAEYRIAGDCLLDLNAAVIHPVRQTVAWRFIDEAFDELYDSDMIDETYRSADQPLVMTAASFAQASLRVNLDSFSAFSECCRFTAHGVPADPAHTVAPTYFLSIATDLTRDTIRLVPLGEAGGNRFALSNDLFWLLSRFQRDRLSQPLKAKKRVTAMVEGFFAAVAATTSTARDKAVRTALATPDFLKRKVKTEAREVVQDLVAKSTRRLLAVLVGADGWCFAPDDQAAQIRFMELLYRMFGLDVFGGEYPGELSVPRTTLLPQLAQVATRLREAGFDLRFGDAGLRQGEWEFTLDASIPSGASIDWFELRPEIRCNGVLLAEADLKALLEGGVLRQGDGLFLIGDEQRRILEILAHLGGGGRKKKKGAAEPLRIPRLQILDWLELRTQGVTLKLPPEAAALITSLTRLEKLPERALPVGLHATLRPYQKEGYDWLGFLYEHRFGACLADDMGLGKTIQTITFLAGLAEGLIPSVAPPGTPHLIVVPPSLLFNWESELARFAPSLRVVTYTGQRRSLDFSDADLVLTSYGILQRDADQLAEVPFHIIIFDEAQQVKNLQTATTTAARRLRGRFTLALTGTPMENHLGEYYAILDLCLPGLLGPYEEFRRKIDIRGFGGVDTLIRRTKPFVLRRSKQMIADELPPRIETDLYLELTPKQRSLYQKTVEEVKGTVAAAFAAKTPGQARMIALTAILRLRQICLCPSLLFKGKADSPKLECLIDQLVELRDEGHSALVFSQFTSYLDIVQEGLVKKGLPLLRLDGSTPVLKRKGLVKAFQESAAPQVFLISLKAGGKGLNLTRATYVYHLDPWWNPAVENQASDRAHRIGQTAQVTVTRLLMRHTVEEKMMSLKERKLKLYQALLDDASGAGGASLSREDFDFLLAP